MNKRLGALDLIPIYPFGYLANLPPETTQGLVMVRIVFE